MSTVQDLIRFGIMLSAGGVYHGRRILREDSFHFFEENQLKEGTRDLSVMILNFFPLAF